MKTPDNTLGLYIHIPFCKSKCLYCDFYSLPHSEAMMDRYTAALVKHLEERTPHATDRTVDTIYFGGGTPSYLGIPRLVRLLDCIKTHYSVADNAEITLEANPESLHEVESVTALRCAGFNRISLGVQSANDEELRAVGRIHTFAQVRRAVEAIRAGGIENLSLDLIYGLPAQTMASWQKTVETVVALAPEHLSCYGLKIEEGTPLHTMQHRLILADDDAQADMYLWMVKYLTQHGYTHYEISNFAREGHLSRHNMKYWMLNEYMGFGPGAHSDFGGMRYSYVRDLASYCDCVERGSNALLDEQEEISPYDRMTEYLMLGLRTAHGIDATTFTQRFSRPFAPIEAVLAQFRTSGHATQTNGRWHLTAEGFLLSNAIILSVLDKIPDVLYNQCSD